MEPLSQYPIDEKMIKLLNEKKSAQEFRERKHEDWNDNYELYRNKVRTNRLTQRQAVNIPLMKETIKTILSRVDDPPKCDWKELSGDEMKELIYQEIWEDFYKNNKLEVRDTLDKKNVLIYGISTKKLNINKTGVVMDILDPFDVAYDPLMNPMDIESARFIVQQNIFKSLREIMADDRYDKEAKDKLKVWLLSEKGIIASQQNKEEWEKKLARLQAMGIQNDEFPYFAGGDVVVNLTEHYTERWNGKEFERRVVVYADDSIALLDEKLEDLIGINEWPFTFWTEDIESGDIYPDSVGDLVRVPNKILNIWFSQQVENRTLQNFQMHWYDSTIQGYTAQTYEPGPGRMLPAPGDPNKTIMPVAINGLDETFNAINFLTNIVERATGATAIEKGQSESGQQTLGEIEILVGKAGERALNMQKFYRQSWYELARKWDLIMQSNTFKQMKLYKTGRSGKVYEKVVSASEWKSQAGYQVTVSSTSEIENEEVKNLQKWGFVLQQYPNNMALKKIAQKRQLEMLDLTPQELKEVADEEEKVQEMMEQQAMMQGQQAQPQGQPQQQMQSIEDLTPEIEQLNSLMA